MPVLKELDAYRTYDGELPDAPLQLKQSQASHSTFNFLKKLFS